MEDDSLSMRNFLTGFSNMGRGDEERENVDIIKLEQ